MSTSSSMTLRVTDKGCRTSRVGYVGPFVQEYLQLMILDVVGPVAGPSSTSHETEHGTSADAQPSDTFASSPRFDSSAVAQIVRSMPLMAYNPNRSLQIQPLKDQIGHLQSEVQRLTAQMTDVDNLKTEVAGLSIEVEILRTKLADMATLEDEVHKLRDVTSNTGDRTVVSTTAQSAKSAGKARVTYVVIANIPRVVLMVAATGRPRRVQRPVLTFQWIPLHKTCSHTLDLLRASWGSAHETRMTAS